MRNVNLEDVERKIARLERELEPLGFRVELKGGLKERGFTSHDVDLAIDLPTRYLDPEDEVPFILNRFGNILYHKFKLELDVDFFFKGEFVYKFDQHGFVEV